MERIGLIGGNGRLPVLFARAARAQGLEVHAVAFEKETDPALAEDVASLTWIKLAQVDKVVRAFEQHGVSRAVMAGGIGRVRSLRDVRLDWGAMKMLAKLKSFRDDEVLRAFADGFAARGITIVAPTDYVKAVLAEVGLLAGPALSASQERDVALGREVAGVLGQADVGQTVVVREGVVLAVEAVEGTDECIRRAGRLAGPGGVVVKRCKPGQDLRFDLPAIGQVTLEVMREAGAKVLAVEAARTVVLDADALFKWAPRLGISVVGY